MKMAIGMVCWPSCRTDTTNKPPCEELPQLLDHRSTSRTQNVAKFRGNGAFDVAPDVVANWQ